MSRYKDSIERGGKSVSSKGLKSLLKNGRDYSKPTLNEILENAKGKKKFNSWIRFISVPMGGMKK